MKRIGRIVTAGALLVASVALARPAGGATPSTPNVLSAGHQLVAGTAHDSLTVGHGHFTLRVYPYSLQLEEAGPIRTTAWATDEQAKPHPFNNDRSVLRMQRNGNLVLRTSKNVTMWQSGTHGTAYRFVLLPSGNMVIKNAHDKVVWATHSSEVMMARGEIIRSGHRHNHPGPYWFQPVPSSSLTMQRDGDLVYRCRGRVAWQSHTHMHGSNLVLQRNGNLVVRGPAGRTLWSTRTGGPMRRNMVFDTERMQIMTTHFKLLWTADFGPANYDCE